MSTHTNGPWELDCRDNTAPAIVRAPYPHKLPGQPLKEWIAICQVYGPSPVREANARLIAASPCLLAACKMLLVRLKEMPGLPKGGVYDVARAAIARAEGESPAQLGSMS